MAAVVEAPETAPVVTAPDVLAVLLPLSSPQAARPRVAATAPAAKRRIADFTGSSKWWGP